MNTVNNLYDKIISKENLKVALAKASRGKRKERKVINALANWQEVIDDLHNQLKNETWRPNDIHRIKIINDGVQAKKREIVCPDFLNEHVIYHAVMNVCKPYFRNRFYKHSYASIPKYGGVRNAIKYIRHAMKDNHETKYFLKLDIKKFFNSIRPSTVFHVLRRMIRDKKVLILLALILRANKINHPELVLIKRGCPIGLYTSQWFANILLTPLDNLIKSFGKNVVPYYVRYNDDMLIFSPNKKKLKNVLDAIIAHLTKIKLKLKEQPQIHMTSKNNIEYIGATISYDKIIMKPKTFLKTRHVLSRIKRKIDGGYRLNSYDAKRILTYTARARFFDMYNFVSNYDFDRGKLKRIVSHADRLKKLSQ